MRFLKSSLIIFISIYVFIGCILYLKQAYFIFPASKIPFTDCDHFSNATKIINPFRAYLTNRSKKLIVYYHGNAGRACDRYYMDKFFAKSNLSTLFVEYPGYAQKGTPSSSEILATVESVNNYLKDKDFDQIIVIGESVGTGPASYHAYIANNKIKKLILITPFSSLADVVRWHYPIYPISILLKHDFTPDVWLSNTSTNITLILAQQDEVVGYQNGLKLFNTIKKGAAQEFEIANAGHNTIFNYPELYTILNEVLLD